MMEPLGHISEYGLEKLKTRRHYCVSVSHQPEKEYTIGIVRLSDAEARIKELEAALDEKEIASGLTSDGNLWRYWASKAKDLALKNADLIRERDAAEALLKEAGKALDAILPMAEAFENEGPPGEGWMSEEAEKAVRAARAIHHKIGVKDE